MIKVKHKKKFVSFTIGFIIEWEVVTFIMIVLLFLKIIPINSTFGINISKVFYFGFIFRKGFTRFNMPRKIIPNQRSPKMNGISTVKC